MNDINDLLCPECHRFRTEHEEWCSLGRCWMTPRLKRWLFLIVMAIVIGLTLHALSGADLNWPTWRVDFEWIAKRKGLRDANQCTPYQIGGEEHPERLRAEYETGRTPEQSFEEMGCDCEVFERVWMKRLRELAKQQRIAIDPRDDEAFEEWLWLEYFTENKPPEEAINAVADSGYMKP
jgi:hypothetical protein